MDDIKWRHLFLHMSVTLYSCYLEGLKTHLVEVEVHISQGLPSFNIVGLGDASIHEAKERARSAIINSGFKFPTMHKTINLAPAKLRKQGPNFDLAIALGLLVESKQIVIDDLDKTLFVGELALNANLKSITGALVISNFAKTQGFKRICLPKSNSLEALLIEGLEIVSIENLSQLPLLETETARSSSPVTNDQIKLEHDFCYIDGQEHAKRSLEIAAAGGHHLLMSGPPGSGKTLLARSLESILPDMSFEEQLDVSKIHSIAGLLTEEMPLIVRRPFREVHHTASNISIIGGGSVPKPGEISLAHNGVLFLDEIAEFSSQVIEALRQPLEKRSITINRAKAVCCFPANFQLVAAMNPCPCTYANHPTKECICGLNEISRYQKKMSGAFRDRIDIKIEVQPISLRHKKSLQESSLKIRERVNWAHQKQKQRYENEEYKSNANLNIKGLKKYLILSRDAKNTLEQATKTLNISMRSYHKMLKIALSISDLDNSDIIKERHLAEALSYRIG